MRTFFLINSLAGGGAERVAISLVKKLKILKIFLLERDIKYEVENLKVQNLTEHTGRTNPVWKTLYLPFYALKLVKQISSQDIVVSFLERSNFVNVLTKLIKKHKAVLSVHSHPVESRTGIREFNIFLMKILYPRADIIIAVSKGIRLSLIRDFKIPSEKVCVIYNPLNLKTIEEKSKEPIEDFLKPFIITAGRLTKPKGHWYLLRVFKKVKEEFKDLKLLILGEGELKEYLVRLSENLRLKTFVWDRDSFSENFDVYFIGFQKNPFKFISKAEFFIFPSLWEGFGMALIEAMVCGVPVVSSDCRSGPREILAPDTDIEHQTNRPEFAKYGVLMPAFEAEYKKADEPLSNKEQMWVEVIKRLLFDRGLRKDYANRAKRRAEDFEVDKIVMEWKKIFDCLQLQ